MRSFLLFLVHHCGSALGGVEIKIEEQPNNYWESAREVCQRNKQLLLPDLGAVNLSLSQMPVDRFFWINAKTLNVPYPGGSFAYLKYALYPADYDLEMLLCTNKSSNEIVSIENSIPWNEARAFCQNKGEQLLELTQPSEIRRTISVLRPDLSAWLANVTDYNLLSLDSTSEKITESCVGMVKLQSGKVLYQKDDCSKRHAYFCIHLGKNLYATTLTKLSTPIENVSEKYFNGPSTLPGPDTASFTDNNFYTPTATKQPVSAEKATEKYLEDGTVTTKVKDNNLYTPVSKEIVIDEKLNDGPATTTGKASSTLHVSYATTERACCEVCAVLFIIGLGLTRFVVVRAL